jgi:hypothetical protein
VRRARHRRKRRVLWRHFARAIDRWHEDAQACAQLPCAHHVSPRELELELIQTQMAQKPILREEVYARALRARSGQIDNLTLWRCQRVL